MKGIRRPLFGADQGVRREGGRFIFFVRALPNQHSDETPNPPLTPKPVKMAEGQRLVFKGLLRVS